MTIRAIYRNGVFEPLEPVDLEENQQIEIPLPLRQDRFRDWLKGTDAVRASILKRRGGHPLPDSTPGIAADRLRPLVGKMTPSEWLESLRPTHQAMLKRNGGPLPDSTPEIAEERMQR